MATCSMFEGVYVCIVRRTQRGDFEPCLLKVSADAWKERPSRSASTIVQEAGEQLRSHHAARSRSVLGGEQ